MMSYQKGLKDPSVDRHTSKAKSRHFTVNGLLSANNTLQQQQNQYNLQPSNDSRNIYNNPYIPPQQQQQQQQQQQLQQQTQQRTAHLFKALAASAGGTNSLTHPYDFSNSSSSSNANNEHQGSSSSEAENAFLTHNNGKPGLWILKMYLLAARFLVTTFESISSSASLANR
ncbi:myb-like protein AA [Drosophila subpulchrella]|uniref:myb-like protein AA n=1 Tax=Drosophila subpulchrella TaxID=1486046 RepID=UPI0018A140D1|nr:myb-like protein AA [Drosophila subpulchrella]XP_037718208.1 myb-like protein AA [Drosophila subpulchrella]